MTTIEINQLKRLSTELHNINGGLSTLRVEKMKYSLSEIVININNDEIILGDGISEVVLPVIVEKLEILKKQKEDEIRKIVSEENTNLEI